MISRQINYSNLGNRKESAKKAKNFHYRKEQCFNIYKYLIEIVEKKWDG